MMLRRRPSVYRSPVPPPPEVPPVVLPDWQPGLTLDTWVAYDASQTAIRVTETSGPSGTARELLITDGSAYMHNWCGKACFDEETRRLSFIATAQGHSSDDPPQFSKEFVCTFDQTTLSACTFGVVWNPTGINDGHGYDGNPSRAIGGYVYRKSFGSNSNGYMIRRRAVGGGAWSDYVSIGGVGGTIDDVCALEVHPGLGTQGSLLIADGDNDRLIRINLADDVVSTIAVTSLPVGVFMHYVDGMECVVFGGGTGANNWWKINDSGTVSTITVNSLPTGVTNPTYDGSYAQMVADPAGRNMSWLCTNQTAKIYSIDWDTGVWTDKGALIASTNSDQRILCALHGWGALAYITKGVSGGQLHVRRVA